jgi:hypothetical protein
MGLDGEHDLQDPSSERLLLVAAQVIAWAVVAHEARLPEAATLAKTIDAYLALDDGTLGAGENHLRAWRAAHTGEADWVTVVEDDAIPVDDITTQARLALAVAPEPVVSMYLGRTRPKRWQERISRALAGLDARDPHWLTTTHVLHAVAVALRSDLVDDWLDWAHTSTLPPDERMSAWCIARGHRVAYSWPSLFNHQDGPTLVQHANTAGATGPRIAWRTGTRDNWTGNAVAM